MGQDTPEQLLGSLFDRAVAVADPMRVIPHHLPERPGGRVVVVGAGKASARMAEAVEASWGPCEGIVITRYGYARPCRGIEIVEAAHPVPDMAGLAATGRMLALLRDLGPDDFVLALISGGASALLVAPAEGVTLAEKQAVNAALLASGAPIQAMNTVRKHLSRVKGGQLAAAGQPARMLALMVSDVPGDDPALIGSGPTVGDATTPDEARAILARWGVAVPEGIAAALRRPSGVIAPADARLARVENRVIAAPAQSLAAAAALAQEAGCRAENSRRPDRGRGAPGGAGPCRAGAATAEGKGGRAAGASVGGRADGDAAGKRRRRTERGICPGSGDRARGRAGHPCDRLRHRRRRRRGRGRRGADRARDA